MQAPENQPTTTPVAVVSHSLGAKPAPAAAHGSKRSRRWGARVTPAVLFATAFGALVGTAAVTGPQPASDLLAGLFHPAPAQDVVVIAMDGASGLDDWQAATDQVRRAGAGTVAAVNAPAGSLDVLAFDDTRSIQVDSGLQRDMDGRARAWVAAVDGRATLPARILNDAGIERSGVNALPVDRREPQTLHHSHLTYLTPGSLDGRIAVLGKTDPWSAAMLETSSGEVPLVTAVARAVEGNERAPAGPWLGMILGGLLGLLGAFAAGAERRWPLIVSAVAGTLASTAGAAILGVALPVEALAAAALTAGLSRLLLDWSAHQVGFLALVDRAIWHLNAAPKRSGVEEDWLELAVSAVDLNVATEAWVMESDGEGWQVRAAADTHGVISLEEQRLPRPFDNPLSIPVRSACGRQATLLMRRTQGEQTGELRALRALAAHQARKPREERPTLDGQRSYFGQGVGLVHAAMDVMEERRTFLAGALKSGAAPRALFDPLGRLVTLDDRIEPVLFADGRPADPRVSAVWKSLGGAGPDVTQVLTGAGPKRVAHSRGLLVLSASMDGHRLTGLSIELVEAQESRIEARPAPRELRGRVS